jgi:hypothetical protein
MQGIFLNKRGEDIKAAEELVTKIEQLTLQTPAPIPASHLTAPPPNSTSPTHATQALPASPETPLAPALPTPALSPHTQAPLPVLSQLRWWHKVLFAGGLVVPAMWWIVRRRRRRVRQWF